MPEWFWISLVGCIFVVPILARLKRRRWWVWLLTSLLVSPMGASAILLLIPPPGARWRIAFGSEAERARLDGHSSHGSRWVPIIWGVVWLGLAAFILKTWWPVFWVRALGLALGLLGLNSVRIGLFASQTLVDQMTLQRGPLSHDVQQELDKF
ncbi:MAG TPA: hypothetical protein VL332_02015 [Candidatus Saccharimonadaceae bacterium]|jgi:hypothetical protein|nr:hypothetical protein [Candidatus Saccharimonadaceae bacterium]